MLGLLVIDQNNEKNIVLSTSEFLDVAIKKYLYEVHKYNKVNISNYLKIDLEKGTWSIRSFHGTYEEIEIIA